MLKNYDRDVAELRQRMIDLGLRIEQAVEKTWQALATKDLQLAQRIYDGDDVIDDLVKDCMQRDLDLTMMQGPVASDYRGLMATLKILSDLERIADHCADISQYVMQLGHTHHNVPLPQGLKGMYDVMSSMVSDVIDFYKERGTAGKAMLVSDKDDIVDQAFQKLLEEISQDIQGKPENAEDYIALVLVVKYIERMADHANNIAESIIYRDTNTIHI